MPDAKKINAATKKLSDAMVAWQKTQTEYIKASAKVDQYQKALATGQDVTNPEVLRKFVEASEKLGPTIVKVAQLQKKLADCNDAVSAAQKELKKVAKAA